MLVLICLVGFFYWGRGLYGFEFFGFVFLFFPPLAEMDKIPLQEFLQGTDIIQALLFLFMRKLKGLGDLVKCILVMLIH